jgi:hypothetical protein
MADRALSYDDLFVTPLVAFRSSGPKGGPFTPSTGQYVLQNTTDSPIGWQVTKEEDWTTLSSPTSGILSPGESITVTVSTNNHANALEGGTYGDTLHFNNTSSGKGNTTRDIDLRVANAKVQPGVLMLLTKRASTAAMPLMCCLLCAPPPCCEAASVQP